jgi:pyruvate/2-oxoglutarate dehydrogenase complex dihydrolipoamide acyltransferase (E2) component
MSTAIKIPKLGMSMTDAVLSEWLVEDGATVEVGTPIYSIETDKSVQEIESPATGTLRVQEPAGGTFEVGHVIATID